MKRQIINFAFLIFTAFALQTNCIALPDDLQQMLSTLDSEAIDFPSRQSDLDGLNRYIANGDYDMARFKAGSIIKQQRNIGSAVQSGIPSDLQQMLSTLDSEAIDFPSRQSDLNGLNRYIANGDYDMARFKAGSIIKKQRNLRQ